MSAALHAYELDLAPTRQLVAAAEELGRLLSPHAEPGPLHAFLIQWASLSVQLHEPIEQFLADASHRCAEQGDSKLALMLLHVALDAIEVYRLLADDTRALAQLWNARRLPHLDMTSLLTQPATPAIRRAHDYHQHLVHGAHPWAELAAVFETYVLMGSVADALLTQAVGLLGEEVRPGLRSLPALERRRASTLVLDAMAACLAADPDRHAIMVAAGRSTLELYGDFLVECCVSGFNLSSWQARQHA